MTAKINKSITILLLFYFYQDDCNHINLVVSTPDILKREIEQKVQKFIPLLTVSCLLLAQEDTLATKAALHGTRSHRSFSAPHSCAKAGHKYITSTEMYEMQELETLANQLNKHHPFS